MNTEQQANFIERVRSLKQRGEQLQAERTLHPNPTRAWLLDMNDRVMDLGEDIAELRQERIALARS